MNLSPILLFVYNRPEHTRRTVEALQKNILAMDSELFIFSDGPKKDKDEEKVLEVRSYINNVSGFKKVEIIIRQQNLGLAASIIRGVTEVVNKYGKVIVLEDDMVTSPHFLKYMNEALDMYENNENVISIHGYTYPVKKRLPETFFLRGADCWGWATWKRGWALFETDGNKLLNELIAKNLTRVFDFDGLYPYVQMLKEQIAGLNNSWAIRWYASAFLANKLTLYPGRSLVCNIGFDNSGTHSGPINIFSVELASKPVFLGHIDVKENYEARAAIKRYFCSPKVWLIFNIIKIKYWLQLILKNDSNGG